MNDRDAHLVGMRSAFAAWELYAAGTPGAAVRRGSGWTASVFPEGPEAAYLNNAVLERGLPGGRLAAALDELELAYAGIDQYAVWLTDDDHAARARLEARGYVLDTSTAAMVRELAVRPEVLPYDAGPDTWSAYVEHEGGLLAGVDATAFLVATASVDGEPVAAALGLPHEGDLGIYNVGTHDRARRRGLATALTAHLLAKGFDRGCTTATLQATPMAERTYARCGFRTVARILELVPSR